MVMMGQMSLDNSVEKSEKPNPDRRRSFSVSDGACDRPSTLPPDMVVQGVQVG